MGLTSSAAPVPAAIVALALLPAYLLRVALERLPVLLRVLVTLALGLELFGALRDGERRALLLGQELRLRGWSASDLVAWK